MDSTAYSRGLTFIKPPLPPVTPVAHTQARRQPIEAPTNKVGEPNVESNAVINKPPLPQYRTRRRRRHRQPTEATTNKVGEPNVESNAVIDKPPLPPATRYRTRRRRRRRQPTEAPTIKVGEPNVEYRATDVRPCRHVRAARLEPTETSAAVSKADDPKEEITAIIKNSFEDIHVLTIREAQEEGIRTVYLGEFLYLVDKFTKIVEIVRNRDIKLEWMELHHILNHTEDLTHGLFHERGSGFDAKLFIPQARRLKAGLIFLMDKHPEHGSDPYFQNLVGETTKYLDSGCCGGCLKPWYGNGARYEITKDYKISNYYFCLSGIFPWMG